MAIAFIQESSTINTPLRHSPMALLQCLLIFPILMLLTSPERAVATGPAGGGSFIPSKAAYYNSGVRGTETGACEYGVMGATLNGGDVSAASNLYRQGMGCGACYQVRCTDPGYCSPDGVTVVITDLGASDSSDFILSQHAFAGMGMSPDAGAALLRLGYTSIEYRRVSCSYPGRNISFKIHESSNNPYYLAFQVWYLQGNRDLLAIQLCEATNLQCKLLDRSHGAVWATVPPSGPLSIRMLLSGNGDADALWLTPPNNLPLNWSAGAVYDSGVQAPLQ